MKVHLMRFVLLLAFLALAAPVSAQTTATAHDRIVGNEELVDWSAGDWSVGPEDPPVCQTFPGGVTTGPGQTEFADSVQCTPIPSTWAWSVTLPGGETIDWLVEDIPLGVEVCGQIFYSVNAGRLAVGANYTGDRLVVDDIQTETRLYDGPWSTFDPASYGFNRSMVTRCGRLELVVPPVPVTVGSWGSIKGIYR